MNPRHQLKKKRSQVGPTSYSSLIFFFFILKKDYTIVGLLHVHTIEKRNSNLRMGIW